MKLTLFDPMNKWGRRFIWKLVGISECKKKEHWILNTGQATVASVKPNFPTTCPEVCVDGILKQLRLYMSPLSVYYSYKSKSALMWDRQDKSGQCRHKTDNLRVLPPKWPLSRHERPCRRIILLALRRAPVWALTAGGRLWCGHGACSVQQAADRGKLTVGHLDGGGAASFLAGVWGCWMDS